MLTQERFAKILARVNKDGSVTVAELMTELDASESTVRRDLMNLAADDKLIKVRGGAISIHGRYGGKDDEVSIRKERHTEEKALVASYAAELIGDDDLVYIDGGTTTGMMLRFLTNREATYVTNALLHAKELADNGMKVYILGGEYKSTTEVIVGEEACESLSKYNFTKGFFGTNGVDADAGFTTPEVRESTLKMLALSRCRERYVLTDASKFGQVATITFGQIADAVVLTDHIPEPYRKYSNIREVAK